MSKTYKGYELMKMLSKGEVNLKQKVNTLSLDYKNCTIDFVIKDRAENIMDLDFELIEDEDIDIQAIEKLNTVIFIKTAGDEDSIKEYVRSTNKIIIDNFYKVNNIIERQNEILQAVKQLDKKLEEKEK